MATSTPRQAGPRAVNTPSMRPPSAGSISQSANARRQKEKRTYPEFGDGDVLILSPTGMVWELHSLMLSRMSPLLKDLIEDTPPIHLTKKQRQDGETVKWRFELVNDRASKNIDPTGTKFKTFKPVSTKNNRVTPHHIIGAGESIIFNQIYDNFFRCVYNLPPQFADDKDTGGERYIKDAFDLMQAAVFLDAVSCVRTAIESHLLRLNQLLWSRVHAKPEGWIHLAARLHSPTIFRECVLHIVGRMVEKQHVYEEYLSTDIHGELGIRIWVLIQKKVEELKEKKITVERQLVEYYPPQLVHPSSDATCPGRAIYADDIYTWTALTLVRQYIMSAYMSNRHHRSPDGGLAFYRTIGAATSTYLGPESVEAFHESFDMSAKGKVCFALALEEVKKFMKPIVGQLLIDRSQFTVESTDPFCKYLTCTEVADDEMPWLEPPEVVEFEDGQDTISEVTTPEAEAEAEGEAEGECGVEGEGEVEDENGTAVEEGGGARFGDDGTGDDTEMYD